MRPEPNQSSPTAQNDAELECYLCLAAAQQASQPQPAKLATKYWLTREPAFLRGLQSLLKGLRRAGRQRSV